MQKGFTFIGLLITLAIIGILAIIVFVVVDPAKRIGNAQDVNRWLDVRSISDAILRYSAENGKDAPKIASLKENVYYAISQDASHVRASGCASVDAPLGIPNDPIEIARYTTPNNAISVDVEGDIAIVGIKQTGIHIVDVSDPLSPTKISEFLATSPGGIDIVGDYAYLADWTSGLRILDISDPTSPTQVGIFTPGGNASSVHVVGNYAYVAFGTDGLRIVDVSDPTSPNGIGLQNTPGNAHGIYVALPYAFIADSSEGLRIIDISIPASPNEVGSLDTFLATDVAVVNNTAYLADNTGGTKAVDVSNPTAPVLVGTATGIPPWALNINGEYLYTGGTIGLDAIDISNPMNPIVVGSYSNPGNEISDVRVKGIYAYLADEESGLVIINVSGDAVDLTSDLVPNYLSLIPLGPQILKTDTDSGYYIMKSANALTIGACNNSGYSDVAIKITQ